MSTSIDQIDQTPLPDCVISAGFYERYLWLGHCIFQPNDYWEDEFDFHQDKALADQSAEQFKVRAQQAPERLLIEQMGCVVKSAAGELGIAKPVTGPERRRLQVYLVGSVSVEGKERARMHEYMAKDPGLEDIESPFRDSHLTDSILRYKRFGRMSKALLNYTSLDKLLPGYQPAISVK